MGGSNTTNRQARLASLQVQSSSYGIPVPWGGGRARLSFNLGWANGFTSEEVKKTQSGGKGGGSVTNISYNYFADIIFFICDTATGPIRGINAIFRDKSVFTGPTCLADAGFSFLATGESGQAVWDYLAETYPDQALGYDTTAFIAASHYQLNSQAGLQNHSGEIDFFNQVGGGIVDANPGDHGGQQGLVSEFLGGQIPQWLPAYIGDLSDFGLHCLAMNLVLSPCLDTRVQASSVIDEFMTASNSECWVRGDGTFQVKPLTDAPATANGVTWTPDLTPIYDLTDRHFIVDNPEDDPVKLDTENLGDIYSLVQLTFKNREHQYNDETLSRPNQAAESEYGKRKRDPETLYSIKDPIVAGRVVQLLCQKYSTFARPFIFSLPPIFGRLEEMDLVTLTNESQELDRLLVRIKQIDRDPETRKRTYRAIEVLIGTASAPLYGNQTSGGVVLDFEADPGDVSPPLLFVAPTPITGGLLQVWGAVASTNPNWGGADVWVSLSDGDYKFVGKIYGSARYGVTTNDFPSHSDPDDTDSVGIDLSISAGTLLSATEQDADALVTLSWLGGELIAYSQSELTGPSTYRLSEHIRRGAYGSVIEDHPAGTSFARLDESIFKYTFLTGQIGQTARVKFLSFNVFNLNPQKLEDVTAYTVVLTKPGTLPGPIANLSLQSAWAGLQFTVVADASENATNYTFRVYLLDGTLVHVSNPTPSLSFTYTQDMTIADGHVARSYKLQATPSNETGDGPPSPMLTVSNPAPAIITGVAHSGSGGSETITWTANAETDFAGYLAYYANTSGFDPTQGQGALFYQGVNTSAGLSGLTVGLTYYVRIAAYDTWSSDVRSLNFSAEHAFTA